MAKKQVCFMIDEEDLKTMEQVREATGIPVSRQIELKLKGYKIEKEKEE